MGGVVVVTGGTRGIGRATAERFLAAGWRVAVNYLGDHEAAKEVTAIDETRCRAYQCDVTDEAAVKSMMDRIVVDLGPVDVLVNNAAQHRGGPIDRLPLTDFRYVLDVSLVGARNCSVAVLDGMKARGSGHVVNVSSAIALIGWRGDTAYAAAKAGLIGLTRALAKECALYGIRVNAVLPGFIETDMTRGVAASQRSRLVGRTLLGEAGKAEDVAGMVYSVATEGRYMTGSVVVVDGGLVLGRDDRPSTED